MAMKPDENELFFIVVVAGGSGSGLFVYSPVPGAGNLVASITAQSGTDSFGNAYQAGIVSYKPAAAGIFAQILAASVNFGDPANVFEGSIFETPAVGGASGVPGTLIVSPANLASAVCQSLLSLGGLSADGTQAAQIVMASGEAGSTPVGQVQVTIAGSLGFGSGAASAAAVKATRLEFLAPSGDTTGATDSARIAALYAAGVSRITPLPGLFFINASISLATNQVLAGSGNQCTEIRAAPGFTGPMVKLAAGTTGNVTIRDLYLNGNNVTGVTHGVQLTNTSGTGPGSHLVENVWVSGVGGGAGGAGGDGIHLDTAPGTHVRNCFAFLNFAGSGFFIASDQILEGSSAGQNFGHGINVTGVNNEIIGNKSYESGWNGTSYAGTTACGINCNAAFNTITGNDCQQNALHGIQLDGTSGTNAFSCTVTGNHCDTNSIATVNVGSGININQAQDCTVVGNSGGNNGGIPGSQLWGIQMVGNCAATSASPNSITGSSGLFSGATGYTLATLVPANFTTPAAGATGTPGPAGFKQMGDTVLLKGQVTLAANQPAFTTIFTLPSGAVPHYTHGYVTPNTLSGFAFPGAPNAIVVTNTGAVQTGASGVAGNVIDLSGIVVQLD